MADDGIQVVEAPEVERALRERASGPLPAALPVLPLKDAVAYPGHPHPARGRSGALDEADRRRARRRAHPGAGRVARPRARRARARAALRRRRGRGRRANAQGPRRDDADPRAGHRAGAAQGLRRRAAVPGRADRGTARRRRGLAGARGADPQRAARLLRDHRADPLPARGAAARGHQHRGALGALAPDRRVAADLDRGEAGAARGGRRHPAPAAALRVPGPRARGNPARVTDPVRGRVGDGEGSARVLPARAAEGDPARARRSGRDAGRGQRAARAHRGGQPPRGRAQGRRPRALAAREAALGGGRVRRHPHLPRVAGRAALVGRDHRQPRSPPRPRGARRRPLRPREGQGPDPRVPRGEDPEPGLARADPLLRRAAGSRQDLRSGARSPAPWGGSSSGSRSAGSATRRRSAATGALTSARCPGRSSARFATPARATRCS